jgi:hypothetical protein
MARHPYRRTRSQGQTPLLFTCIMMVRRAFLKVAWEFQPQRPDTDHFNRDYKPELARGGTEICRLNPSTGAVTALTTSVPPGWDFRCCESPNGRQIAFCRAQTGGVPRIWVMNADGSHPRLLTRGLDEQGVDHPRWLPAVA